MSNLGACLGEQWTLICIKERHVLKPRRKFAHAGKGFLVQRIHQPAARGKDDSWLLVSAPADTKVHPHLIPLMLQSCFCSRRTHKQQQFKGLVVAHKVFNTHEREIGGGRIIWEEVASVARSLATWRAQKSSSSSFRKIEPATRHHLIEHQPPRRIAHYISPARPPAGRKRARSTYQKRVHVRRQPPMCRSLVGATLKVRRDDLCPACKCRAHTHAISDDGVSFALHMFSVYCFSLDRPLNTGELLGGGERWYFLFCVCLGLSYWLLTLYIDFKPAGWQIWPELSIGKQNSNKLLFI